MKIETPSCFGSNPNAQDQAENDCRHCAWLYECHGGNDILDNQTNAELTRKLEIAKKALEFYTLKTNYNIVDEGRNFSVEYKCYELNEETYDDTELGTKARAALKELEK